MKNMEFSILQKDTALPFQVVGIRINFDQNDISRPEGYQYDQIVWFSKGSGVLKLGDKSININSGTVLFMPKGIPHEYHRTTNQWVSNWICFSGWACKKSLYDLELNEPKLFTLKNSDYFISNMNAISSSLKEDKLYGNEIASSYLYSLIIEANRIINKNTNNYDNIDCSPIIKAIKYIDEYYFEKISIGDLCNEANLSESQLCRLFQKHLSMRPMEYIMQKRIKISKELLLTTNDSIMSISQKAGYDNPTYFSMLFKKSNGISPTAFRKLMI